MKLTFEIVAAERRESGFSAYKTFDEAGGTIGRSPENDWHLPDSSRLVSGQHAEVTFRDGAFYLTDVSSNGIELVRDGLGLRKYDPHRIEHGSLFRIGQFEIQSRIERQPVMDDGVRSAVSGGAFIPDDVFLGLDPLANLDADEYHDEEDLLTPYRSASSCTPMRDHAPVGDAHLIVPELVAPETESRQSQERPVDQLPEHFRSALGTALGLDLAALNSTEIQALAVQAAHLLGKTLEHLQLTLRNRDELKDELRLAPDVSTKKLNAPIAQMERSALIKALLLEQNDNAAQGAVLQAFRDLQTHQVALVAATRVAHNSLLERLSPQALGIAFEKAEGSRRFKTDAYHWRAYRRWHASATETVDGAERLLSNDFAQAYDDQVRLIATLKTDIQG